MRAGANGVFKRLNSTTLSAAAHAVDFDLSEYLDYDYFVVRFSATLSADDWIYLRINGSRQEKYTDKGASFTNCRIALAKSGNAAGWIAGMSKTALSTGVALQNTKPSVIGFEPYTASTTFGVGSEFTLYGAKLE